jgi:hypothetical protein
MYVYERDLLSEENQLGRLRFNLRQECCLARASFSVARALHLNVIDGCALNRRLLLKIRHNDYDWVYAIAEESVWKRVKLFETSSKIAMRNTNVSKQKIV